jgi:hypothetical protein
MGDRTILSDGLITQLKDKRIIVLAQATTPQIVGSISEAWLSSEDIGLGRMIASEWERF